MKVEIPEPIEEGSDLPSLNFDLDFVGTNSLNLSAGEDCMIVNTGFDRDQLGVYSFSGAFEIDESCNETLDPTSLRFTVRDHMFRTDTEGISENGIQNSSYEYFNNYLEVSSYLIEGSIFSSEGFEVEIKTSTEGVIPTDFKGCFSQEISSEVEWIEVKTFDTDFDFELVSTEKYYLQQDLLFIEPSGIFITKDSTGENIVLGVNKFFPPSEDLTYLWSNGAEGQMLIIPFDDLENQFGEELCVQFYDDLGIIKEQCISLFYWSFFDPFFIYSTSTIASQTKYLESEELQTVIIEYTDPSGKFYSSSLGPNGSSNFNVLEIEEFPDNPQGLKSKKLKVALDCKLFALDGTGPIELPDTEGTIAVSFPN